MEEKPIINDELKAHLDMLFARLEEDLLEVGRMFFKELRKRKACPPSGNECRAGVVPIQIPCASIKCVFRSRLYGCQLKTAAIRDGKCIHYTTRDDWDRIKGPFPTDDNKRPRGSDDGQGSEEPDCKECMEAWDNKPPCGECWWLNARKGVRDATSPVVSS